MATGNDVYVSNAGSASLTGFASGPSLTPLGNTATDAGTIDAPVNPNGPLPLRQDRGAGVVDEFHIGHHGPGVNSRSEIVVWSASAGRRPGVAALGSAPTAGEAL